MPDEGERTQRPASFVALGIEANSAEQLLDPVRAALEPLGRDAPRIALGARLHLTIAFLGAMQDSSELAIARAIADDLAPCRALVLRAERWLWFPDERRARMGALAIHDDGVLARAHARTRESAVRVGVRLDRRAFRPHITVLRFRRPARRPVLDAIRRALEEAVAFPLALRVDRAGVWRSRSPKDGPSYDERHAL